ncbi:MAG: hypothetical protein M5R36_05085 [Deltaproteobacteria bacterium]|nr:hypothetical protein [Deltaproteobacteria bacterium]
MKPSATKTAAAVVVIVTALSYAPSIGKPFLWDDFPFIVTPSADRALTDIPSYFAQDQHLLYRPLRATAYTIAHALFGLHPLPYRVIAIGLHLALTLLFLSILRSIGLSPRRPNRRRRPLRSSPRARRPRREHGGGVRSCRSGFRLRGAARVVA